MMEFAEGSQTSKSYIAMLLQKGDDFRKSEVALAHALIPPVSTPMPYLYMIDKG